jgi:4-hydroxybenzoate polyprenyltransferase
MMNDEGDEFDAMADSQGGARLGDYLRLMRLPNVFTAVADVAMGFLFVQATGAEWTPTAWGFATLATLIAASSALYIAGIVLNDVFDLEIDRIERPERPIPSGRVSFESARRLGWRLLFLGVALASCTVFFTGHLRPGVVAALLATTILLYDAWLKRTPLGPLAMGACRMLNVLLGMSAIDAPLHAEHWLVAGAIGVYVAGVTHFARNESGRSSRVQLSAATAVMMLGIAMLSQLPHWSTRLVPLLERDPQRWYMLTGALGLLIGWRCLRAVFSPEPRNVRRAVAHAILSIIMLDAVACYATRDVFCASAILLLLLPAMFLGRWIHIT